MAPMMSDAPTVIVTGRALPSFGSERLSAVSVIDANRLRSAAASGLDQIVRESAGVQLFRRSDARSSHPTSGGVTLRGLGGNAASRVTVTLDGVPQADPFGGWIAWTAIDPDGLAEVRVVRGGGLVAAGPGAVAGAIELTSSNDSGVAVEVALGSRQSAEGRLAVGGQVAGGLLSLRVNGAGSAGFVPVTRDRRGTADFAAASENAAARLRWVAPLGASSEVQASLSGFSDARDRGVSFTDNRSRGGDASLRLVGRGRWGWTVLGYAQERRFRSSFAAVDAARSIARRTSLQHHVPGSGLGWSTEVRPPVGHDVALRLGADGRQVRGRSEEFVSYVAGAPTRERVSGGASSTIGAFAEASGRRGALEWSAAGRVDRWRIAPDALRETLLATGVRLSEVAFAARSGTEPTGRVAVGADAGVGLRVRSAAYAGWRLPTLNELFRPFRVGSDAVAANAGLTPERVRGVEAGLDWRRGGLNVTVTAFANRLAGPVVNATLGAGPGVFPQVGFVAAGGVFRQRRNVGTLSVRGIEAEASARRGPWRVDLSTAFTQARMHDSDLAGHRPAQTPALSAVASLGWIGAATEVRAVVRHNGPQFEDDQNRLRLPSATTLDAFAAWTIAPRTQVILRAENILNAPVIAGLTSDGVRERATPRTLWLGLRLAWRKEQDHTVPNPQDR